MLAGCAVGPAREGLDRAETLTADAAKLYRSGRYPEGIEKAREALTIRERVQGPEHPEVGMLLQVLGDFTWRQGNYGEAEALHRRAIAIAEKAYGPQDPRVAARLFERPDADVPQNHPGHAAVLDELGKVYRALGRTAEAQEAEARAAILRTMR